MFLRQLAMKKLENSKTKNNFIWRGAKYLRKVGFEKKVISLEWKNDRVMDDKSGDGDIGDVR